MTPKEELEVKVMGLKVRLLFFLLAFIDLFVVASLIDRSVFETSISALTLGQIFTAVMSVLGVCSITYLLCRWLFHGGRKNYESWITLGMLGVLILAAPLLWVGWETFGMRGVLIPAGIFLGILAC